MHSQTRTVICGFLVNAIVEFYLVSVRIKCRDLVKKIAIYRHRLAVSSILMTINLLIFLYINPSALEFGLVICSFKRLFTGKTE